MTFTKQFKVIFILMSLFYIFIGVALIVWPETSVNVIRYLLGGALVLFGLLRMISYFRRDKQELASTSVSGFALALGILSVLFGGLLLFVPQTLFALPFIVGLSIVVNSVMKIQLSVELKKMSDRFWWVTLLLAIITGAVGVLMILNPSTFGAAVVLLFIALSLILDGIVNLWTYIALSRVSKKVKM